MLKIEPVWAEKASSLPHSWAGMVNIDQFHWLTRRDVQDQLERAHHEIGAKHVRACAMYSGMIKILDKDPKSFRNPEASRPRANFRIADYVFDSLLDRGLKPIFTTCFVPPSLASSDRRVWNDSTCPTLPNDFSVWKELVTEHVRHVIKRYGKREVREWYFECWNEPNLDSFFEGSMDDFLKLWKETWQAIKLVDEDIRFGGPSTARAEWIENFIEWTEDNHCPADYIITHLYNNDSESGALSPFEGPQADKISNSPHFSKGVFQGTRALLDRMGFKGELHWNEWGRSWFPFDPVRESAQEAAFIVKNMAESAHLADYYAYWNLSDVYDQLGYGKEAFHGNYGMISLDGLRKLNYHAHELLQRLGKDRIDVEVSESNGGCTGAIATRSPHHAAVLVYQMDPAVNQPTLEQATEVTIKLPEQSRGISLTRLSETENNPIHRWKQLNAPDYPNREELASLQAADTLQTTDDWRIENNQNGDRFITFKMQSPGVALVEMRL